MAITAVEIYYKEFFFSPPKRYLTNSINQITYESASIAWRAAEYIF